MVSDNRRPPVGQTGQCATVRFVSLSIFMRPLQSYGCEKVALMIKTARLFAFGAVAGAAALLSVAPAAKAQTTTTFAQYFQTNPSQQAFSLTNSGASSTITSSGTSVLFNYAGGLVAGTLNFSAVGATAATSTLSPAGTNLSQTFSNYTFSILGPGSVNLLSGSGSNLVLSGTAGGGSSTLNVSTPPVSDVVFTSSVIDLSGSTARNFSIGMSSVNPVLSLGANGYINSFTAASSGTFANNASAVPEPGMMTFALTSGAGLAGMVLRGRRKFKKAA